MEAITRIVVDSLARHGLDRPIDPRRLQWSRWSRCDSPHSLLVVPSKPGIFALAEEIMDLGPSNNDVGTAALACPEQSRRGCPAEQSSAEVVWDRVSDPVRPSEARLDLATSTTALATRRMLAVLQFSEDDDMAFTLDRRFTQINPMLARLASARCFLRFVVIEDESQRRSICNALNQWLINSAEKASGLPADFSSTLELASVGRTCPEMQSKGPSPATAESIPNPSKAPKPIPKLDLIHQALYPDSGANKHLHCPHPLPSGF
jgi:hypothetical protein